MIELVGTTWDHTRGYAPLAATAQAYRRDHPEVSIQWKRRSLQDLADFPIEALAESHDLVVIDHPSVGACAGSRCFLPLDELLPVKSLTTLAEESAGRSHESYHYDGHQWPWPLTRPLMLAPIALTFWSSLASPYRKPGHKC
jgi:multiple sugar transport system substrate-binding protein